MVGTLLAILLLMPVRVAAAHGEGEGWMTWIWPPTVWVPLLLAAILYGRGLVALWTRAGIGRGVPRWRAAAFAAGLWAIVVALMSPVAYVSESLLSVHMVQHLILLLIAMPLVVMGAPLLVMLWGLPVRWRKAVARRWVSARSFRSAWDALSQPLVVWALYAIALWMWHLPTLYEAALNNSYVHDVQHAAFMATAGLLWWVILSPMGRVRLNPGAGVLYLFTTSLHATALGVFITLSPVAWYGHYAETVAQWNLSVLEDQQMAGAIMWMPACLVYIGAAALLFLSWMRESERGELRLQAVARSLSRLKDEPMDALLREAERGGRAV